ncbi:MAG TPA: zinc ribbon domain-containing protein [Terracidiphilus sp.]|nr:zinc ribbon domain-containing protein [Terracidiphilus sp.]
MFTKITLESDGVLYFHAGDTLLATTKAFTHGGIIFAPAGSVTVGRMPAIPLPSGLKLEVDKSLSMQLVAPDGTLKSQTRTDRIMATAEGLFRVKGKARNPSACRAEDGWSYTGRKYRAYLTHPGAPGSPDLPLWLLHSIERQGKFWDRLVWRLKQARRACSDVAPEELREFVTKAILPAIDIFNHAQGKGLKLKYPRDLTVDEPSLTAVWSFAGKLARRAKQGKPVPEGLEAIVLEWARQHKTEMGPLRDFEHKLADFIDEDAETFGLRSWEKAPKSEAFRTVLLRRRRLHLPFAKGWPRFTCKDPQKQNWRIHFHLNKAGIPADAPFTGKLPSLHIGDALPPERTGHASNTGKRFRVRRAFRPVKIAISDRKSKETWALEFSILQHQPIPKDAFLKQWELIYENGKLWLCMLFQVKQPSEMKAHVKRLAAGLDLGWRSEDDGVKVATLWNPVHNTFHPITVNLTVTACDSQNRPDFIVFMGPSRASRRASKVAQEKGEAHYLDTYEGCAHIQQARSTAMESIKSLISREMGDAAPPWLRKSGSTGIRKLGSTLPDSPLKLAIDRWAKKDEQLGALHGAYAARIQARLRKGYEWVANDIGKMLQADRIPVLAMEESFLQKPPGTETEGNEGALEHGAKYRHWVAPAALASILDRILPKFGVRVIRVDAANTTRTCRFCRQINENVDEHLFYQCTNCGRAIQQDENAAVNIARASASNLNTKKQSPNKELRQGFGSVRRSNPRA